MSEPRHYVLVLSPQAAGMVRRALGMLPHDSVNTIIVDVEGQMRDQAAQAASAAHPPEE